MSVTRMAVDPETTWWLVRTSPSADSTIPVPAPCAPSYPMVVLTSTRPLDTAATAASCAGVRGCCVPPDGAPGTTPGGAVLGGLVWAGGVGLGRVGLGA